MTSTIHKILAPNDNMVVSFNDAWMPISGSLQIANLTDKTLEFTVNEVIVKKEDPDQVEDEYDWDYYFRDGGKDWTF